MSGRLVGEVLNYAPRDLTHLELLCLVSLAESARDTTRTATYETSCEQIADRIASTPASVKSALYSLRHRGLIVGIHEKPRRGLAQEYRIPKMTEATKKALVPINPLNGHRRP